MFPLGLTVPGDGGRHAREAHHPPYNSTAQSWDHHLPTLLSCVFAPTEECQDPAYCNNRTRCQQCRVAILREERQ
jgi:hypothetical protein